MNGRWRHLWSAVVMTFIAGAVVIACNSNGQSALSGPTGDDAGSTGGGPMRTVPYGQFLYGAEDGVHSCNHNLGPYPDPAHAGKYSEVNPACLDVWGDDTLLPVDTAKTFVCRPTGQTLVS